MEIILMYSGDIWTSGLYAFMGLMAAALTLLVIYWLSRAYDSNNRLKQRSHGKKNMITGSMGRDPVSDILDNRPLGGVYLMGDGDVVPFLSSTPDDADEDAAMEYDMALSLIHI